MAQATEAAGQEAEREEAARAEADKTLKALVKSYRAGEAAYRKGLLEAGRLAHAYVVQRLTLRDKRDAAVQAVAGELAKWSSSKVDVNRLIQAYHASALLAEPLAAGLADSKEDKALKAALEAVPYGHYRDVWGEMVTRQDGGTPAERWALLAGMEEECAALFVRATRDRLSKDAAKAAVKQLLAEAAKREREAAQARAQEATARAEAAQGAGEPLGRVGGREGGRAGDFAGGRGAGAPAEARGGRGALAADARGAPRAAQAPGGRAARSRDRGGGAGEQAGPGARHVGGEPATDRGGRAERNG